MGRKRNRQTDVESKRRKEEKMLQKMIETPEEKRKRRLEKKARKERRRKRKGDATEDDLLGYTNASNPFGDTRLTEKFVWRAKREKLKKDGIDPEQFDAEREHERRIELKEELEKAKKRREEREQQKKEREEERLQQAREREREAYADWEQKEHEFHLEQAKRRSEIRIAEQRPKPVDILYKNLIIFDDDSESKEFDIDALSIEEPYKMFMDLRVEQLEELKEDIEMYSQLDNLHDEFWYSLDIVCNDELVKARAIREDTFETAMHQSVTADVSATLVGKSYDELTKMHNQVCEQIDSDNAVDSEYWEALEKKLVVCKAKSYLHEIHTSLLKKKLEELEEYQDDENDDDDDAVDNNNNNIGKEIQGKKEEKQIESEDETEGQLFSPVIVYEDIEEGEKENESILDPEQDKLNIIELRKKVIENIAAKKARDKTLSMMPDLNDGSLNEHDMYEREAQKHMDENEETFDREITLERKVYWWQDKYRPRKPKYFNRVHTGYEWNKYNRAHYDHDEPPPKIVQGYKFNVFYPDLIDPSKPPRYFIETADSPDTCIIRFHAGPPYEDVAFKIVNREWEYSHKKGFKCVFDRGVLNLWFNFRRYRYRR